MAVILLLLVAPLLQAEDIECFQLDVNMSVLEGSIGVLPRRLVVRREDLHRARLILGENGIEVYKGEDWL